MKLKFVVNYFSEPLVGGYTTGAAIHVLFPQIAVLMGINVNKSSRPGYLFEVIFKT